MSAPTEPREGDFYGSLFEAYEYRLQQRATVLEAVAASAWIEVLRFAESLARDVEGVQRQRSRA